MFPMEFFTDWSPAQRRERAQYCLEKVNVIGSDNKYPNELSGGMQKRVGIARAIALNPEYLFCDEPNSGLDPYTSILIDRLIHDLTKEFNMTTVVNTHDMNSILEIGDRIGFIHQGSLIWQGDKDSILKTECSELREFVCANTLARNIIEGKAKDR
jgi:phospholipid/cholesterol/gamma-HCH transport system ATP-binding protein